MTWIWDTFVHLDKTLGDIINDYQGWTYLFLFFVIFCETGLVVTPFLPGDSLLFAAGAFAAQGDLNLEYYSRRCTWPPSAAIPLIIG